MRFAIYTLGCKVNQYESQALERQGAARGHTQVPFEAEADAYIINTCTVTAVSDQKNRQVIRRVRRERPEAVLAVCGCFPQTHPGAAEELGADLVAGTGGRERFWALLEQTLAHRSGPVTAVDDAFARRAFEELPAGGLTGRTRCMLKVEDGCVNFCSYCIIPYARGPVRSLPLGRAVAQARHMAAEGYREMVVTGIELSSWGRDLPGKPEPMDLLEALSEAAPEVRLRLGSLEPRTVTEDFCRRAAKLPNLCPHFHLSLQSGCAGTLKAMNRRYDPAGYLRSVELLRRTFDDPGLTTDLIVGFPGETEEDFRESLDFVERCAFSALHVFPYSRRPGTPAARMPDQVPAAEKKRRAKRAGDLAHTLRQAYLERQVGKVLDVLFEEERDGLYQGHAPNYTLVKAPGRDLHNRVLPVRIQSAGDGFLLGTAEA